VGDFWSFYWYTIPDFHLDTEDGSSQEMADLKHLYQQWKLSQHGNIACVEGQFDHS